MSDAREYWALSETDGLAQAVSEQVERYYAHLLETGRLELLRKAHNIYHGLDADGRWKRSSAVTTGGEAGELLGLRVNEFRSLAEHIVVLTTGSRPAFTARATSSDYESQAQVRLAEGLLDYYLDELELEELAIRAVEYAVVYAEGWIYVGWDHEAGDDYGVEPEQALDDDGEPLFDESGEPVYGEGARVIKTGDIEAATFHPLDVIRDTSLESQDGLPWIIAHRRVSRWDLAARFPEHAAAIENATDVPASMGGSGRLDRTARGSDDVVSTFELWHGRTPAVPDGRYALVCGDATLMDTPLPFDEIPFVPVAPSKEIFSSFGYSRHFDLMALQESLDAAVSTMVTNHDAFGVQRLWVEKGDKVSIEEVTSGLVMVESMKKPEAMQLTATSEHSYRLTDLLTQKMEAISGVNSVARGNPESSLKSGAALALVHSMAVQYNSGVQRAYARAFERAGSMLLARLRHFAQAERVIEIAGRRGSSKLVEFRGEDLGDVRKIKVDMGNAVLRTAAGRKEIADKFLEQGVVQDPEQYLEVMATGRLDPILEGPRAQRLLTVSENEDLAAGKEVIAMVSDHHASHIQEHLSLLADPQIRRDATHASRILAHILDHQNKWVTMDPVLLAATGQVPPPAPMMPNPGPMGPDSAPMGDPQPAPMGAQNPEPASPPVEVPPVSDMPNPPIGAQQAGMPSMPELPPNADPSLLAQ